MPSLKHARLLVVVITLFWAASALVGQDAFPTPEATSAEERAQSWQTHQHLKIASPFREDSWRLIGPRMCGGRIEAIAAPPGITSTLYVGAGSGGVWKTLNNGVTWFPIFDEQPTQAIGDIAVSESDPQTVWVGSGEVLMARSAIAGLGVFKSTNGGQTWKSMGLEDTHHIARVRIHPKNPEIVYVAAIGHRHSANRARGIFRTEDGGETWQHCLSIAPYVSAMDLAFSPDDPRVLFATTWQRDPTGQDHFGNQSRIYRTSNGGESWQMLTEGLPTEEQDTCGRIAIAIAPSDSSVVYALIENLRQGKSSPVDRLFRSDDGGDTWQVINQTPLSAGWDWCEIAVAPDNPQELYSIGQNSFVSRDGGVTFEKIGGTIVHLLPHDSSELHLDTHSIWIDPLQPNRVIFGNDGGLYQSFDRCQTWLHHNTLPIAECYAVTLDAEDPVNVYIGTQDNAALFGTYNQSPVDGGPDDWRHVYLDRWGGGDSYFTYRDPTNVDVIYYEHQYGYLMRKNMRTERSKLIQPKSPDDTPLRFAWMAPYFPSVHEPTTLYFAANRIFRSRDRGDHWEAISGDLAERSPGPNTRYRAVTALAESPLVEGLLFSGSDQGEVYRTDDDGVTWTAIHQNLPPGHVTRIAPSKHDPDTVYLTMHGLAHDDFSSWVFVSDDRGNTWQPRHTGLPFEPVRVILEDPKHAGLLYLGTEQGVYCSLDQGRNWLSLCEDLPACSVYDLAIASSEGVLIAATHGRSVFVRPINAVREQFRSQE